MNGQNYQVFGFCPLSSILRTIKCRISTFGKLIPSSGGSLRKSYATVQHFGS
jgi:hypothetical protein